MLYTVKEVAEKTGLTPYTIRYYLKEGLFPNVERDSNGTRLFRDSDLESFYMIECMKRCGMTINEIHQYMEWLMEGDHNIDKCLSLFQEKMDVLKKEMERLKECMEAVSYKIWYYETAKDAGTLSIHETLSPDDIPKDMKKIRARMMNVKQITEGKKIASS